MDHTFASSLVGYLSILCWLIVFTPQLWENYKRKSGDGLSMTFLAIWLAGDVFNLLGVIMQDLLVTMFVLALYYTLADMGLIWQVIYYQRRREEQQEEELLISEAITEEEEEADENTLLIGATSSSSSSYRSTHDAASTIAVATSDLSKNTKTTKVFNILSFISIVLVTVISCWTYYQVHWIGHNDDEYKLKWLPQLMGWTSALLYVGSRIPQILKNMRHKSTEGLSFGMFLCAVMGNILFTMSIFLKSTEKNYILMNLSWIVGSCGTLIFDFIIFIQFFVYEKKEHQKGGKIVV